MRRLLIFLSLSVVMIGCGVMPPLDPVAAETRVVRSVSDASKTVTVQNGMVWYNTTHTRGLRFPPGTYALEAEDENYLYLRCPFPLEFKTFNGVSVTDARTIQGGIMIGKAKLSAVPAGGYIDGEGTAKIMVWKLGGDFLSLEGLEWKKSF